MPKEKPHLNLVFIGHVDHGKSTTVGRLFYDLGLIDQRKLEELRKEAEEKGKAGFEFAYVMDKLKEERERGITIDVAYRDFETPKYYFTIIDAPGHVDFIKNMITGAAQADAAVLVVAATEGVQPQTKEHAILAKTLGINQMIVAINKMDMVNYDQKKFEEVKAEVEKLLKGFGYDMSKVIICPSPPSRATTWSRSPRTCPGTTAPPSTRPSTSSRSHPGPLTSLCASPSRTSTPSRVSVRSPWAVSSLVS